MVIFFKEQSAYDTERNNQFCMESSSNSSLSSCSEQESSISSWIKRATALRLSKRGSVSSPKRSTSSGKRCFASGDDECDKSATFVSVGETFADRPEPMRRNASTSELFYKLLNESRDKDHDRSGARDASVYLSDDQDEDGLHSTILKAPSPPRRKLPSPVAARVIKQKIIIRKSANEKYSYASAETSFHDVHNESGGGGGELMKPASHFSTRHGKSCSLQEPKLIGGPTAIGPNHSFERNDPSRPGSVLPARRSTGEVRSSFPC